MHTHPSPHHLHSELHPTLFGDFAWGTSARLARPCGATEALPSWIPVGVPASAHRSQLNRQYVPSSRSLHARDTQNTLYRSRMNRRTARHRKASSFIVHPSIALALSLLLRGSACCIQLCTLHLTLSFATASLAPAVLSRSVVVALSSFSFSACLSF